jgi:hypothetical protein
VARVSSFLLAVLLAPTVRATELARVVPAGCAAEQPESADNAERAWNQHYFSLYQSLWRGDLDTASAHVCAALRRSAGFGPRDWRFAEALDELGRLEYLRGNDEASIAAQAAAVAEVLLARGPRASEPELYARRLGLPLQRSGRPEAAKAVAAAPYRVFTDGLVPVDRAMAGRLDWLVSEYLALEQFDAARALQHQIDRATK